MSCTEKDYEALLQQVKKNYEERLEGITSKVRLIYEEIRTDEILSTMREDPASNAFASQRIIEICEDNLAQEREETIHRLHSENTALHMQVKRSQQELGGMRKALLRAEEQLHTERETNYYPEELALKEDESAKENKELEHKSKSYRMKKKILEQKAILSKVSRELETAQGLLDSTKTNYEQSLAHVQDDLSKVRNLWEQRCRELQQEHSLKLTEFSASHQQQLRELQLHYQTLLSEKLAEIQSDTSTQLARQREMDLELARKLEEKMAEIDRDFVKKTLHEQELHEQLTRLRAEHLQELSELEGSLLQEHSRALRSAREEHHESSERLQKRLSALDEEKTELLQAKRQVHSELECSSQQLRSLSLKVNSLQDGISALELTKQHLQKDLEGEIGKRLRLETEFESSLSSATKQLREESSLKLTQEVQKHSETRRQLNQELESSAGNSQQLSTKYENELSDLHKQLSLYQDRSNANEQELRKQHSRTKQKLNSAVELLKKQLKTAAEHSLKDLALCKSVLEVRVTEAFSAAMTTKDAALQQKQAEIQRLGGILQDSQNLAIQEQASYEDNMKTFKREITEKQQENNESYKDLKELQAANLDLEQTHKDLKQQSVKQQEASQQEINALTQQLAANKELYEKQHSSTHSDALALKNELARVERKTNGLLENLQTDLLALQDSMADEKVRAQKLRAEKLAETDTLRSELKGLKSELQLKNGHIEQIELEKNELKQHFRS